MKKTYQRTPDDAFDLWCYRVLGGCIAVIMARILWDIVRDWPALLNALASR